MTDQERLTALEVKFDLHMAKQTEMDAKLDELLALRNKGMGVFWLASTLVGTGILGFFYTVLDWIKHP